MSMKWIIAAQGLTLSFVSVGLVGASIYEFAAGDRDPLVVAGFGLFFVCTTIGGAFMAKRNWPDSGSDESPRGEN
ncbi:MAG: hypothetical protein ACI9OJ_006067 [Myxococcota bacterium]|jgi:hypothetical protein